MALRALLFCAFGALTACASQGWGQGGGGEACQAGDAVQAASMLQKTAKQTVTAWGRELEEDGVEEEEATTAEAEMEAERLAFMNTEAKLEAWRTEGKKCTGCKDGCCKDGCIAHGRCHTKTPWGTKATEGVCKFVKGEWCGVQATCETSCPTTGGCLMYSRCFSHAPESLCKRFKGKWCPGVKVTCDACKGGCIVDNKCYQKAPRGQPKTEETCLKHKGAWCGATCASCNGGCIIDGHCYQDPPAGENKTAGTCSKYGGKWCEASRMP